ncbi:MAG: 2-oxoacid:ferredoxin oxidoreductase subunit gamma [Clostridiales bacterium]|nr:2-oxoacid:ferredoxin oxidoreductase subunit gamma [Clostridiales bacterium]
MSTKQILIAGFGGQGILFAGKFLAYEGLLEGKKVSWLPSYGPEMRGGTANCSIILSDDPVGSPIVNKPDVLIAMNLPSLDKYENEAVPGASIFVDSALIERKVTRKDVNVYYIPATKLASEKGFDTLANMIIIGHAIAKAGIIPYEGIAPALKKVVSAKHANLLDKNIAAIELGYQYEGESQCLK